LNSLAPTQQIEYQLTVLNGPDKGAVYRLVAKQITIGRGAECDIVIRDDSKVSRTHAKLSVQQGEVEITDISDRNRIIVNGDDSPKQILKHNAIIQLGETKMQFKFTDSAKNTLQASPRNELNKAANFLKHHAADLNRKVRRGKNGRPSLVPLIVIMAVVAGIGYFMTNKNGAAPVAKKLGGDEEILRRTASVDQELSALEAERKNSGEGSDLYNQAQAHYIKGAVDYSKGQYERAMESFKACLALMPTHRNCLQYSADAEREWGQEINDQIIAGSRYKSQNQYAACAAAFKNVLFAVKVRSDARYIEAESNLKFCEAKMKDRY
jgi:pSer/pThr/pTyr-binding forkhead associated (FHA) protein